MMPSVSRAGIALAALVVIAGAVLAVLAYRTPSTGDGQEALVIPFIVFWTFIALVLVWGLDRAIRAYWRDYLKRR
jgi:hypothetical protein